MAKIAEAAESAKSAAKINFFIKHLLVLSLDFFFKTLQNLNCPKIWGQFTIYNHTPPRQILSRKFLRLFICQKSANLEKIMTRDEFKNWLDSFLNFEKLPTKGIFWLDTMEFLAKEFGNPQDEAPCVHVAGSKGKGSVSRMISSILAQSGKKVGLYTSPHIKDFYERVSLNGEFFSEEIYSDSADKMRKKIDALKKAALPSNRQMTWFELVTLYAFLCFKNAKTDANVFEVGLGGRLDTTNIVRPKIAVINTIELEHTEFLGDTLEKIAGEKAGIIKEKTPVLCAAPTSQGVREAFEEAARKKSAPLFFADELCDSLDYSYEKSSQDQKANALPNQKAAAASDSRRQSVQYFMNVEASSKIFSRPIKARLSLLGKVQAQNAFLAAAAVRLAFPEISEDTIERGLEAATLPARFQTIALGGGLLVLDGAHTVNSIKGTMETFNSIFGNEKERRPFHLLFACAADKDVHSIAPLFKGGDGSKIFNRVLITKLNSAKQSDPKKAAAAFKDAKINFSLQEDYQAAIKEALEAAQNEGAVLLAIGSFYLASEILSGGYLT